jgi:hypothetical protein
MAPMSYRIPSRVLRCFSYLGLPLAVICVVIGQSQQAATDTQTTPDNIPRVESSSCADFPEFQAVTDRTTELGGEEMPAYWRLLKALERRPIAELTQQSLPCESVDHLLQTPQDFRGHAVQLTLNVRRVLAYEIEGGSQQGKRLYEAWGWLDSKPDQLIVVVTQHLPTDIKVGATVYERAQVCGYFFKLQGYLPAGAQARMSPLAAPLLIGHLEKCPQPQVAFARNQDWWRIGAGTLLVLSLVGSFSRRSRTTLHAHPAIAAIDTARSAHLENWLECASIMTVQGEEPSSPSSGCTSRRQISKSISSDMSRVEPSHRLMFTPPA